MTEITGIRPTDVPKPRPEVRRGGIPYGEILQKAASGETVGQVEGSSGNLLDYRIGPNKVSVADSLNSKRYMMATVSSDDSTLELFLYPKQKRNGLARLFRPERHPDMYASGFVDFVLRYFEEQGTTINRFKAHWVEGEDNYEAYKKALGVHDDKKKVLTDTWSGKTLSGYGFTDINEDEIKITNAEDGREVIEVVFRKPQQSYTSHAA